MIIGKLFLGIVFASSLFWLETTHAAGQDRSRPTFGELSSKDVARLDRQRAVVSTAVKQRYGAELTRTQKDLPTLQKLIDDSAFTKHQTYELQSLGVAFGDVLASALPLRWVMVTDEYGTDPTLRYNGTSLSVNALTMISKRVEKGQRVSLSDLLKATKEQLASVEKNAH